MNASLHPAIRARSLSALSLLFARYVAGQINDSNWERIMRVFDTGEASPDERVAFANFISDVCIELGPEAVNVPQPEEVDEMLTWTRG